MAFSYDNHDRMHHSVATGAVARAEFTDAPFLGSGSYSQSLMTEALPMPHGLHGEHSRILIVDDHGDTGRALKRLLKRRGYDAQYVTSGHEAVEAIRRGDQPVLVILDVMMPDMSGLQTLAEMRKTNQFDDTPVVMYSASEDPATMQQAFRLGARDYILKGSDWDEMMRRIDTVLPA